MTQTDAILARFAPLHPRRIDLSLGRIERLLGDVQIAEPGAVIGFAGARVIEQTVRERLPEGFQRAEFLEAHGMVDIVAPRPQMRATLARLCKMLTKTPGEPAAA